MENGENRERYMVDTFFKTKFPAIALAKPAFTVVALAR
jgi:hypothetical protein